MRKSKYDPTRVWLRTCKRCDRIFRGSRKASVCSKCVKGKGTSSEII